MFQISDLKVNIEQGTELVGKLRKQSKLDKEESEYVIDELNNDIMDLDVSKKTTDLSKAPDSLLNFSTARSFSLKRICCFTTAFTSYKPLHGKGGTFS